MDRYILLFRAVNVGGKNPLPMKALAALLEEAGYAGVSTYIQSGNVVLQTGENPQGRVAALVGKRFGFAPEVMAFSRDEFAAAVAAIPYPTDDGKALHLYFCSREPDLDTGRARALADPSEAFALRGRVLYLYAPEGIGRSRLVRGIEACLGCPATGRNLNTVRKLLEISGR